MNNSEVVTVKVYQVGLGRIRATYALTLSKSVTMKDLYGIIEENAKDQYQKRAMIAATIEAYNPSKIGYYRYPGRIFVTENPTAVAKFVLDKSDPAKTITDCGITDGCELMYNNGEMD